MARPRAFDMETVLNRATEMFWTRGYHATSMDELLKHMKLSRASFYTNFTNKETLYQMVLERYRNTQSGVIERVISLGLSPLETIKRILTVGLQADAEGATNRGCFMVNSTSEMETLNEDVKEIIRCNQRDMEGLFEQLIRKAQEKGEINPSKNAAVLAVYIFSYFQGVKLSSMTHENVEVLQATLDVMMGALV
ncbi:MAG: TetR/AcrR family transcriptional regulator [Bacteroidota bacterium]